LYCFENTSKKQDWESVFTKRHFRIGPIAVLVLHQAVSPTFHNKIALMSVIVIVDV